MGGQGPKALSNLPRFLKGNVIFSPQVGMPPEMQEASRRRVEVWLPQGSQGHQLRCSDNKWEKGECNTGNNVSWNVVNVGNSMVTHRDLPRGTMSHRRYLFNGVGKGNNEILWIKTEIRQINTPRAGKPTSNKDAGNSPQPACPQGRGVALLSSGLQLWRRGRRQKSSVQQPQLHGQDVQRNPSGLTACESIN